MLMGTADFQTVSQTANRLLFAKYMQPDRWLLFPQKLGISHRSNGTPDFQLDLVRSSEPGGPAYGVVDFRVEAIVDLESARSAIPERQIEPGQFSGGWLRLCVREPAQTDSLTILPPVYVTSNGLGAMRLAARMTPDGITLLKRALLDGSLLLEAWAEMEIQGVSPRIPAQVTFGNKDVEAVRKLATANGLVPRQTLVATLAQGEAVSALATRFDRFAVAEALADRLLNLAGTRVPSPDKNTQENWRLAIAPGQTNFHWDLNEPVAAARGMVLRFDPVPFLRTAAGAGGLERFVVQGELPEFKTGYLPLVVTANLADARSPVVSCGVDIEAAPRPPHRLSAIRESVEFESPRDRQELVLRYAADEAPEYEVQTFLFVQTSSGVREWRSPRKSHSDGELRLGASDFAARFVPVEAWPPLLAHGKVLVTAHWQSSSVTVTLDNQHPADTLVCDASAENIVFTCRLEGAGGSVEALVQDAPNLWLDLSLFREYGSHQVVIELDFTDGPESVGLQIKPQDEGDSAASTLAFTPARAKREWAWFAKSPFAPGYQYRVFQNGQSAAWSAARSPFEPLRVKAAELKGNP